MGDGEERRFRAESREATGGAAVKLQLRRPSSAHNLDVTPKYLLSVTGSERFHRRFLCGEAPGKMDRWGASTLAVRDLPVGEDAMEEALAVSFDCRCDSRDISRIETKANDGRHQRDHTSDTRGGFRMEAGERGTGPRLPGAGALRRAPVHDGTLGAWGPHDVR